MKRLLIPLLVLGALFLGGCSSLLFYPEPVVQITPARAGLEYRDVTLTTADGRSVTKPVTLDVTYKGVAKPPWFNGRDVIGFDASTTVKRSEFGMVAYIPNIGDDVTVEFSGEFVQDE